MSQAETNPNASKPDEALSDEQLEGVAGGLSGRIGEEFKEGLGNKGISGRTKEEFEAGLGNKGYQDEQDALRDKFGNG